MGEQAMLDQRSAALAAAYRANGWWRDRTLVDDFLDASTERLDRAAVVTYRSGHPEPETITYRQLRRYVDRMAGALLDLGVQPGDVVSMQLPNGWEFVALSLACARVGAVVNPLVPIFRHRELTFILGRTQARICVVPATFRGFAHGELLAQLARELPTLEHAFVLGAPGGSGGEGLTAPCRSFEEHFLGRRWEDRPGLQAELDRRRPGGDDLAEIQFTSGTTGEPKGVQHTWNTVWSAARSFPEILGFGPDDVAFMASTVAHQTGFLYGFVAPMMLGLKVVFQEIWDANAFVRIVDDEGVTYTVGATPFVMDAVIAQRETDPRPSLDTFRWFCCGGAPIPPTPGGCGPRGAGRAARGRMGHDRERRRHLHASRRSRRDGRQLRRHSGGLDAGPDRRPGRPRRQGRGAGTGPGGPAPGAGASQTVGYYQRPDLYEACLHPAEDGGEDWFDTGDLAWRRAEDGGIRIAGRAKDLVIRGGENVPVVEVEAVLYTHPRVAECAVVGIPDERLGERACVVVVPSPSDGDAAPLTLVELVAHCEKAGMARQFWPERLELIDEMPKTPSGKIQKFLLRQQLVGG